MSDKLFFKCHKNKCFNICVFLKWKMINDQTLFENHKFAIALTNTHWKHKITLFEMIFHKCFSYLFIFFMLFSFSQFFRPPNNSSFLYVYLQIRFEYKLLLLFCLMFVWKWKCLDGNFWNYVCDCWLKIFHYKINQLTFRSFYINTLCCIHIIWWVTYSEDIVIN